MKKSLLLYAALFGLLLELGAFPVDLNTAQSVAGKFMHTTHLSLSTVYQTGNNQTACYVFNTDNGFVIVSG